MLVALPLFGAAPPAPHAALSDQVRAARAAYHGIVERDPKARVILAGLHLDERLADDADALTGAQPADFTAAAWEDTLANTVALDTNLVEQLAGTPSVFALETGLHERIIRSPTDHALDAVAIYVPPVTPRAVVVVLHGNPQTESQLLGQPYLRAIADETGTILIAPYGRGSYDFRGTPTADFYGLVLMLKRMPALSALKFYLVGYSMGGFTAYMIGPDAPVSWSGVLDISGALVGSVTASVIKHWQYTRVYVVHGGSDPVIPTRFSRDTAIFLYNSGLAVSYYEVGGAGHYVRELVPAIRSAWHDMLAGIVRDGPAAELARSEEPKLPGVVGPPAKVDRP